MKESACLDTSPYEKTDTCTCIYHYITDKFNHVHRPLIRLQMLHTCTHTPHKRQVAHTYMHQYISI